MSGEPERSAPREEEAIREAFARLLARQPEPDAGRAWAEVWRRYALRERAVRRRWVAVAAGTVALALVAVSGRLDAVPELVARWQEYRAGPTLRQVTGYFSPGSQAKEPPPEVRAAEPPAVLRFRDAGEAQRSASFPLLLPGWLPEGAALDRIEVTNFGRMTLVAELVYRLPGGELWITEHPLRSQVGTGTFYDTEDAVLEEVTVRGARGMLLRHKSGYVKLQWAIPGYLLTVSARGADAEAVLRVAESLAPAR